MKRFRVTSEAESDLDEIWLFIAEDDPDSADRFHDRLLDTFLTLASQPMMGRSRDELRPGIRSFPVDGYVIFYRDTAKLIEIIRVLAGSRDIGTLLS